MFLSCGGIFLISSRIDFTKLTEGQVPFGHSALRFDIFWLLHPSWYDRWWFIFRSGPLARSCAGWSRLGSSGTALEEKHRRGIGRAWNLSCSQAMNCTRYLFRIFFGMFFGVFLGWKMLKSIVWLGSGKYVQGSYFHLNCTRVWTNCHLWKVFVSWTIVIVVISSLNLSMYLLIFVVRYNICTNTYCTCWVCGVFREICFCCSLHVSIQSENIAAAFVSKMRTFSFEKNDAEKEMRQVHQPAKIRVTCRRWALIDLPTLPTFFLVSTKKQHIKKKDFKNFQTSLDHRSLVSAPPMGARPSKRASILPEGAGAAGAAETGSLVSSDFSERKLSDVLRHWICFGWCDINWHGVSCGVLPWLLYKYLLQRLYIQRKWTSITTNTTTTKSPCKPMNLSFKKTLKPLYRRMMKRGSENKSINSGRHLHFVDLSHNISKLA